jgi:hypothetical protein
MEAFQTAMTPTNFQFHQFHRRDFNSRTATIAKKRNALIKCVNTHTHEKLHTTFE